MKKKKLRVALAGNANVGKSLDGEEYVFIELKGEWKIIKIKDLANRLFSENKIKKIGETDYVLSSDVFVISLNLDTLKIEKSKVTHVLRHKEKRKLTRLTTASGRTLTATPDHNFITLDNGIPKIVNAKQLQIGDSLPVVEKIPAFLKQDSSTLDLGGYLIDRVTKDNRQYQFSDDFAIVHGKCIPRHIKINEKLAYFFGIYVAEGCINKLGVPRLTTGSDNVKKKVETLMNELSIPYHIFKSKSKNAYDISISKALTPILEEFGHGAGTKKISPFVFEWNKRLIQAFLDGYFEGDGWQQTTAIHATTKSPELQLGLSILIASIERSSRFNTKIIKGNPYYEIRYVPEPSSDRSQWLENIKGLGKSLQKIRISSGLTQLEVTKALGMKMKKGSFISALEREDRIITKKFSKRLVNLYEKYPKDKVLFDRLKKLAYSEVVWDEVVQKVETDENEDYVYDLTVEENNNFMLANGLFVHNSVVFNYLTTLHQHIGNWPGKTIEKAEGSLIYKDHEIDVIDLPGIYSLRALSAEEEITRDYIAKEKPDVVINIVDATVLERNLFLTLQLRELGAPMVLGLNMMDLAEKKGIRIDIGALSRKLGIPVVPIVATQAKGISEMLDSAIRQARKRKKLPKLKSRKAEHIYAIVEKISRESITLTKNEIPLSEKVDSVLLHRFYGYLFLALAAGLIFLSIFSFGDFFSGFLMDLFSGLRQAYYSAFGKAALQELVWGGVIEGVVAAVSIALPYLIPFYIVLSLLEDSGYLARMAFLMDSVMHKIGLHGKAFIPLMLGYGCTVPACLCCRIMETPRERLLAGFVVTLIPCAARTVIILGLVGAFVGIEWALGLYLFNLLVVFVLGRIAFKALPGEPMGLIMEMPSYKMPSIRSILRETWGRTSDFIHIAFPIIVAATILIKAAEIAGITSAISDLMSPVTVGWLGLPALVGITFIFGILRKELALIMLAALLGTENFAAVLTPVQMIVFTLVMMFYIPCAATIATLNKEYGWKKAGAITLFEIVFAIILGGLAFRVLGLLF